jgi:uncharacterized membrane protein YcaP (DUF421 family)
MGIMESVARGLAVYLFVLFVFRISGKRTLSEATAFDLALLLIISETIQQALVNGDESLTNAAVLIVTLVGADLLLSAIKHRFPACDSVLDGTAVILLRDGKILQERLDHERIDISDILEAARIQQGLETLDQIKLAVLERSGEISIIPKKC